jgi:hybrid polyketide synthase / nonribosomal peptide synthetase ACE1
VVLDDVSINEMTFDQFLKVTRPKVEGSIHLDALFRDNTLDFFVFFCSALAFLGHPGQANYSAANLFMSGLAEERHQRGLAASVINIGPVLGVGYLSQHDIDFRGRFEAVESMFVSEQDFHQLFAEAVLAGRPGGAGPIEVTTGLGRIGLHDEVKPGWASNPITSHCIKNDDTMTIAATDTRLNVPLKTQLSKASNRNEVYRIIKDAFDAKLGSLYQLPTAELTKADPSNLHLNQMGTDSLLAAELRGWLMKTFQVNMPVLRILSGITVHELLTLATETIPSPWIPGVSPDDITPSAGAVPPALKSETQGPKHEFAE